MNGDNGKENYLVTFMPSGRLVKVASGVSVIKAARLAGVHINASCGGSGVCGKCRIILENGTLTGGKSEKLTDADYEEGYRQACIATIESNATLRITAESELGTGAMSAEVPIRHQARMHIFNIEDLKEQGVFMPPTEKRVLHLSEPTHEDNMADAGRVIQGLGRSVRAASPTWLTSNPVMCRTGVTAWPLISAPPRSTAAWWTDRPANCWPEKRITTAR
jgi:ferredoxin